MMTTMETRSGAPRRLVSLAAAAAALFVLTAFTTGTVEREGPLVETQVQDTSGYQGQTLVRNPDGSIGEPVANVRLTFTSEDGSITKETTSNQQGRYRIQLPPGRYVVEASHPEYRDFSTSPGFFVVRGKAVQTGNIFLRVREARPKVEVPEDERYRIGETAPQEGDPLEQRSLPRKGEDVPPIAGGQGEQPPAGQIDARGVTDPQGQADTQPDVGWEEPRNPPTHVRIRLLMTRDDFRILNAFRATGRLPEAPLIDGQYLYVIATEDSLLHAGTFKSPLVGYGFDPENELGHSETRFESGAVTITAPSTLLDSAVAERARITFYRLPESTPADTPVSVESAPDLVEVSEELDARVEGKAILQGFQQQ